MNKLLRATTATGLLLIGATISAQPAPPPPGAMAGLQQAFAAYHKMPDTRGTGPFPALKEVDPAFPGHVVYRPADLGALGKRRLPVLLWGNGGCTDDGAAERLFLEQIASYGYLVLAPGSILSGPGVPEAPPPAPQAQGPGPGALSVRTTTEQVHQGLEEAQAANDMPGRWHDRLDLARVAVGGYSCGGLQALAIAADPRIKAVVITHSGIFKEGGNPIKGMQIEKSALEKLHTPVLYLLGGKTDIAYPNGTDDYARIVKYISFINIFMICHVTLLFGQLLVDDNLSQALDIRRNRRARCLLVFCWHFWPSTTTNWWNCSISKMPWIYNYMVVGGPPYFLPVFGGSRDA